MSESEAKRMLRQQKEWQQARHSGRSEDTEQPQQKPPKRTSRRLIMWGGVGVACLVGYSMLQGNSSPPAGPTQGVAGVILGLTKNAATDCRNLAAQPIEAGANKYGEPNGIPFSAILGPSAVGACSKAVENNPKDAESWRRLGRAYIASASYAGFNEEESSAKAGAALNKAAELGDVPASVLVTIMGFDGSQTKSEILSKSKTLAEKIRSKGSLGSRDLFYYAVLHTVIMEIESLYDAQQKTNDTYLISSYRDDYKREHAHKSAEIFAQSLRHSGGLPFYQEGWDLELLRICGSYDYVCKLVNDTVDKTKDSRLFMAIAANRLQEAYRITELEYHRAGNNEQAVSGAHGAGLSLASVANFYTTLAEENGGGQDAASIARLKLAYRNFQDYASERYNEADAAASKARSEAWTALAAVVVANALTSSNSASSAKQDQSVGEYLAEQERIRCATAGDAAGYAQGIAAGALAKAAAGC